MDPRDPRRVLAKGWFLTYPQCPESKEGLLEHLKTLGHIVEYVVAAEKHEDGNPHLHAFVRYERKVRPLPTKFDFNAWHGNYQVAKSWRAVEKYCKKGGDYIANIDLECAKAKQNKKLLTMDPRELVDQGEVSLTSLPNIVKARMAYALLGLPQDKPTVRGIWITGKPGTGKSHHVRAKESSLFLKAQNKWWDGYVGQPAVLLDDFDKQGACLGHHLKIWADRWACTGEYKGSTGPLNYDRFYITSNYTISEIFPDDTELREAISRRFRTIHMFRTGGKRVRMHEDGHESVSSDSEMVDRAHLDGVSSGEGA